MIETGMKISLLCFLVSMILVGAASCSKEPVVSIKIDNENINWAEDNEVAGDLLVRNLGSSPVRGEIEIRCSLKLDEIQLRSLDWLIADFGGLEGAKSKVEGRTDLNQLGLALVRFIEESPIEYSRGEVWDIELDDEELKEYEFSAYSEISVRPHETQRLSISADVPGMFFGRSILVQIGDFYPESNPRAIAQD